MECVSEGSEPGLTSPPHPFKVGFPAACCLPTGALLYLVSPCLLAPRLLLPSAGRWRPGRIVEMGRGGQGRLHTLHCHFEPPEGAWVWVWGGFELAVCPRYISEVSSGHSFSRLAASWCWAGVSVGASLDLTTNPGTCAFRAKVASHWGGCPSTGDWPHGEGQLT